MPGELLVICTDSIAEVSDADRSQKCDRIIGDETTGSKLGVIPQDCKDGKMGNRNLYHFCLAMIIFLDITVPLALLAVAAKSRLGTTLSFLPIVAKTPEPSPQASKAPIVDVEKGDKLEKPGQQTVATTMFIGEA